MDAVRFGRALGAGARAAAKTVVQAADAAAAPNPRPAQRESSADQPGQRLDATAHASSVAVASGRVATGAGTSRSEPGTVSAGSAAASTASAAGSRVRVAQASTTARGLREGTRRFAREVSEPVVRLSGVLWLEFAGVFFGIFALFALNAAWRLRGAWHQSAVNASEYHRLLGAVGMLAVFGYFCVSSFVRASRRSKRR